MYICKASIIASLLLLFVSALPAQPHIVPAPPQEGAILLTGATAHLGNGEVIENALIGFAGGKLTLVGAAASTTYNPDDFETVVDLAGKHIYPGFILPTTDLGLVEVGSLNDTRDNSEQGSYNPSVRSIIAYNTDSELIPTMRIMGILMAQTAPSGSTIAGNSSVVQLDAWNWEDAAYLTDDAIHLYWPARQFGARWWMGEAMPRPNPNYDKTVAEIEQWLGDALAYGKLEDREGTNLHLEALQGLFDGSKGLFIHADDAKSIVASATLAKEMGVERIVIAGAAEAILVKDFLLEHDIPVILSEIHELPNRDHEDTVQPYKTAAELYEAGIDFCIGYDIGMTARARNLPFLVGTAIAYGLPYEEGVKAVTSTTARLLNIDERVGTLETGKDATLFVSAGDAFDMRTNIIEHAFIQGRQIQLEGRQEALYKKYADKYGHP